MTNFVKTRAKNVTWKIDMKYNIGIISIYKMNFEWDPEKSQENKKKHGVTFYDATEIWQRKRIDIPHIAYSKDGEICSATIGFINGILFTAIGTKRKKLIRLICVRRARDGEKKAFFETI